MRIHGVSQTWGRTLESEKALVMICPAMLAEFFTIIVIDQFFGENRAENPHFPLSWQPVGHFDPPKTIC